MERYSGNAPAWGRLVYTGLVVMLLSLEAAFAQRIIYVNDDATGANNGSSWADAYTSLQSALAAATSGDQIWVAAGVYKPTAGTDRNVAFTLKSGVEIYGGFAGTESSLDERDWQVNSTILSGDIDNNDVNTDGNFIAETWADIAGDNSSNVVRGANVDSTAELDGFVITAGTSSGMELIDAGPTLRNLTFSGSGRSRGGLYVNGGSLTLTDVTLTGNRAGFYGGGMYVEDGAATLTRVTFDGNRVDEGSSYGNGGGLYADNSTLVLTEVAFTNNWARSTGGGAYIYNNSTATLERVTFDSNSGGRGGGVYIHSSTVTISNSQFISNTATGGDGGGMYVYPTSVITISNSQFISNTAISVGGGIFLFKDNTLIGTDLTFQGNEAAGGGGGLGGFKSSVTLTRAIFENNTANGAAAGGGGLYLGDSFWGPSTATLTDVIFIGNTATDDPGGGLAFTRGTLTFRRGLIANNTTPNDAGGGFYLGGNASATLENVTISGNTAGSDGVSRDAGGIYHGGASLTLRNVTIANNSATSGQGEGIYVLANNTPLTAVNTIIADNGAEDFRRNSSSTSAMRVTYSLIERQGNAGLTDGVDGNLIGRDPLLGPLGDNGGFSQTHALLASSPAFDAGEEAACPGEDQRGVARPLDGDNDGVVRCDLGAVELAFEEVASNWLPRAVGVVVPQAGDTLHIDGRSGAVGQVKWARSYDPDSEALRYTWQLAADSLFGGEVLSVAAGADTVWVLTYRDLAAVLDTLARGEVVRMYQRVVVSDEAAQVAGPSQRLYLSVVNHPPLAPVVVEPADEARIVVEGEPDDTLWVRWRASGDADGDTLSYRWELAADSLFGAVLLERVVGTDTLLGLRYRELADWLDEQGANSGGEGWYYHRVVVSDGVAEVVGAASRLQLERGRLTASEAGVLPERLVVGSPYPNPTADRAQMRLELPWGAEVCWSVYDLLGRRLRGHCEQAGAGAGRTVILETAGLAAGVYLYRLVVQQRGAAAHVRSGRLVLVR